MPPRVPLDTHTACVVAAASFASVYYTLYPWIQEQKATKAKLQYDAFQQLKQDEPERAQAYIDNLRAKERWHERMIREYREKQIIKDNADNEYFAVRNQHGLKAVQFPDELYAPIDPAKRIKIPTTEDLDNAQLIGRSLTVPQSVLDTEKAKTQEVQDDRQFDQQSNIVTEKKPTSLLGAMGATPIELPQQPLVTPETTSYPHVQEMAKKKKEKANNDV